MTYLRNKKGETLIEVLTALTALVLAALSSVTLVIAVMSSTAISKDYLLAQNLAREAIESVVNIRDTNWLKYPSSKGTSWMYEGCDSEDFVDTGFPYIIEKDTSTNCNKLSEKNTELDLQGDPTANVRYNSYKLYQNENNYYVHSETDKKTPQPFPVFYRSVKFTAADNLNPNQKLEIEAKVQWLNKSKVETYVLKTLITNYEN